MLLNGLLFFISARIVLGSKIHMGIWLVEDLGGSTDHSNHNHNAPCCTKIPSSPGLHFRQVKATS
jgi:hypothetical protein